MLKKFTREEKCEGIYSFAEVFFFNKKKVVFDLRFSYFVGSSEHPLRVDKDASGNVSII